MSSESALKSTRHKQKKKKGCYIEIKLTHTANPGCRSPRTPNRMAVPGGAIRDDQVIEGLKIGYLKKSGFWQTLNHFRDTGKRDRLYTFYMWFTLIGYAPLFVTSAAGPFFTGNSLEELTLVLLNPVSAIQVAVKFAGIWYGIDIHARLMDLCMKGYLKCVPETKRERADDIMSKAVKKANFMTYLPIYSNIMTILTWNILPILRSDFMRDVLGIGIFGKAKMHNKILGFWYPVDVDVSPWTELVYVYEIYVCTWAAFVITLYECTLIQLTALLIGHMRVLAFLLSEHKPGARHSKQDNDYLLFPANFLDDHRCTSLSVLVYVLINLGLFCTRMSSVLSPWPLAFSISSQVRRKGTGLEPWWGRALGFSHLLQFFFSCLERHRVPFVKIERFHRDGFIRHSRWHPVVGPPVNERFCGSHLVARLRLLRAVIQAAAVPSGAGIVVSQSLRPFFHLHGHRDVVSPVGHPSHGNVVQPAACSFLRLEWGNPGKPCIPGRPGS